MQSHLHLSCQVLRGLIYQTDSHVLFMELWPIYHFAAFILYDDILLRTLLTCVPSLRLALGYPCARMVGACHGNAFHIIVPFDGNPPMSKDVDNVSFPKLGIATFFLFISLIRNYKKGVGNIKHLAWHRSLTLHITVIVYGENATIFWMAAFTTLV